MAEQSAWTAAIPKLIEHRMQNMDERQTLRRGAVPRPVSKSVAADARGVELVGLLGKVPAGEATMTFRGPLAHRHERGDSRSYLATLNFGGLLPVRQDVEIDVTHFGANVASVTVRSAEALPKRVSEQRYNEAVNAVLGSLERLLPWQSIVADTPAKLFASPEPATSTATAVDSDDEVGDDDEQAA